MTMIYVAPGSFMMGSPSAEIGRDEDGETQHRVTLTKGFWLGETEVTQAQWYNVMGYNPSIYKDPLRPVNNISWFDCQKFIARVNEVVRQQFGCVARLPFEAEWEYACRAGSQGRFSGTGNLNDMGWSVDNSGDNSHRVKLKSANTWGFYDMHGNVWEWCQDRGGDLSDCDVIDPIGPLSGKDRVMRGGCWSAISDACRSAKRIWYEAEVPSSGVGFRLACSPFLYK